MKQNETENRKKSHYDVHVGYFIILILIFATIVFQRFTKSGIIILIILFLALWKVNTHLSNI